MKKLDENFIFGVAISGFQAEGGFNGPGEPANNWERFERTGRVETSGIGVGWWERIEEYLDLAQSLGVDMVRLGIEWARIEPREGEYDTEAISKYRAMMQGCLDRGMKPMITLHHFTHPNWLGEDFWLDSDSPERFAQFAQRIVPELKEYCTHWVTLNEINALSMATYLFSLFPPARSFAFGQAQTSSANLLNAHVKAYEIIHSSQPEATVHTNTAEVSIYELNRMLIDTLMARRFGIKRDDLESWLISRKAQWYGSIEKPNPLESLARKATATAYAKLAAKQGGAQHSKKERAMENLLDSIYSSEFESTMDVIGFDFYDPVSANHVSIPGQKTSGGRNWSLAKPLWDDGPNPKSLERYCKSLWQLYNETPVWVIENGMCSRVKDGISHPRIDGWDRPRYLRENISAVIDAMDKGADIKGYLHWSLVDNYEWGSYQPRFGLYGIDRERGCKIMKTDAQGHDAGETYKRIIAGLKSGDFSVLRAQ